MEFRFNLNEIFKEPIVEIGNSLIPPGFTGDKRALWDTQGKITQIINAMGEASASAQGLSKPITTADRLRNSEHKLYLLIDQAANSGKGEVTGMLKTGEKGLYVFDREGQHYQVSPPCVLDFYIHESRQRSGFGKNLFEHMLQKQQIEPVKMAIDRPSDKLLGFLNKHYGLNNPVKQMNNYVVYDGFFPKPAETSRTLEADKSYTPAKKQSANGLQHGIPSSPYGRYGAPRPPCSMGQIIHNDSAVIKRNQEPTGIRSEPITNVQGQYNMYNSNQVPAWQATQSVPNMPLAYSQSQLNPAQMPQYNQQYAQNPQYAQYQQFGQNQNVQFQSKSGDHSVNTGNLGQPMQASQMPLIHNQNPANVEKHDQNYQQGFYNYTMGQGDATSRLEKDQNVNGSAVQNTNQIQHQQIPNLNQNQVGQHLIQNENIAQNQPQFFTYQGQNYYYNPQTHQYQVLSNQYHNVLQNQQNFPSQIHQQANMQKSQQVVQQKKEPLTPQYFDGTVRKVHQSVSEPIQRSGINERQNLPAMVQGTASAPVNYQHHAAMTHHQQNTNLNPAYNIASISQASRQNELSNQVTNQNQPNIQMTSQPHDQTNMAALFQNQPNIQMAAEPHNQPNIQIAQSNERNTQILVQNQPVHQTPNLSQAGDQSGGVNQPANINMSQLSQINSLGTPYTNQIIPQPSNVNQQLQNQIAIPPAQIKNTQPFSSASQIQNLQPVPSVPQVTIQNSSLQQQTQNQMALQNIPSSYMIHQNQTTPQMMRQPQSGHVNLNPHFKNTDANIAFNQVVIPQTNTIAIPNQMTSQPLGIPQHLSNQHIIPKQHIQNIQPVSSMSQVPNNFLPQQQQEQTGTSGYGQETNRFLHHIPVEGYSTPSLNKQSNFDQEIRRVKRTEEVDLSKGYPPQHNEKSAQNSTPKADRPQSLNIEMADDLEQLIKEQNDVNADTHEEPLDGNNGETDSFDGDSAALEAIEQEIGKIEVAPKEGTPLSVGSRSPGLEAAGIVTPGRSTPGLTEQGYFDLKFYHNKLW